MHTNFYCLFYQALNQLKVSERTTSMDMSHMPQDHFLKKQLYEALLIESSDCLHTDNKKINILLSQLEILVAKESIHAQSAKL